MIDINSRYVHLFQTAQEFQNEYENNYSEPWVSYTVATDSIAFNKPHYVEIAGVKWATMNLGATAVTDYGKYYTWGDTTGYYSNEVSSNTFDSNTYVFGPINWEHSPDFDITKYNTQDGLMVLQAIDDAATQELGGNWRMPTVAEYQSLIAATNSASTTDYQGSGVRGIVYTDKTDSSKVLFFPAAGYYEAGTSYISNDTILWTSEWEVNSGVDYAYCVEHGDAVVGPRYSGLPIRGILDN